MVSVPQEQINALVNQLQAHKERLLQLRTQMTTPEDEAAVQEMLIRLGQDTSVLSMLGSLRNQPALATNAVKGGD